MAENTQLEVLWTKIKERAEKLINPISYSTFVESLTPVDVVNRKIVLQAVTEQGANVVVTHHLDKLREAVASADVGLSNHRGRKQNLHAQRTARRSGRAARHPR